MAFAEEDAVVAELFGPNGAVMNLIDSFDAAVDTVETELERHGNAPQKALKPCIRTFDGAQSAPYFDPWLGRGTV